MIRWLDHVNLRTADVERMARFYVEVVGLRLGDRPPFEFPGAWLYAGERAVVHLVGEPREAAATASAASPGDPPTALKLEHFAFAADDLEAFELRLEGKGIAHRRSVQTGTGRIVVNLRDPDGNRLHVDFDPPARSH
jgi:catechol 2,3-dioxygenase-like lactoylglutathione lyase family enzyme